MTMPNPTDKELAKLRPAFDSCDSNREGYIDRAEFHALLKKIDGDVSRAECELDL
jgi:Ca2+-binding EF-hand superfamily protein